MQNLISLLKMIDEPNSSKCIRMYQDNKERFDNAYGSTNNHQAWSGGYIGHLTDGMNLILDQYNLLESYNRIIPFTMSDALLVFWLHDLEKPWRIIKNENYDPRYNDSCLINYKNLHKDQFDFFKLYIIEKYEIELTTYQYQAYKYVEGEKNDYSSKKRVMNELAAFCHGIDNWSARGWYNYPET